MGAVPHTGEASLIHYIFVLLSYGSSMRLPRIKGQGQSFYHCVSRVGEGRLLF
jgi:hypothetical protein